MLKVFFIIIGLLELYFLGKKAFRGSKIHGFLLGFNFLIFTIAVYLMYAIDWTWAGVVLAVFIPLLSASPSFFTSTGGKLSNEYLINLKKRCVDKIGNPDNIKILYEKPDEIKLQVDDAVVYLYPPSNIRVNKGNSGFEIEGARYEGDIDLISTAFSKKMKELNK